MCAATDSKKYGTFAGMNSLHENIKFPQYRRYKNGLSYFKILSLAEFEEIKIIGTKRIVLYVKAKQYPEKVYIHDLLFHYQEYAEEIMEKEYLEVLNSKY
jgi:hypothetical protein